MHTTALTREQIMALIPQRPPFLFVDRVVELTTERVVSEYDAQPEAPFFQGHYPGNPVMPGVLLCEATFQAGALLIAHRQGGMPSGTPVLTRVRDARFKHMVRPGRTLRIEVSCDEVLDEACYMTGRVSADERLVVRVAFAVMLAETAPGAAGSAVTREGSV